MTGRIDRPQPATRQSAADCTACCFEPGGEELSSSGGGPLLGWRFALASASLFLTPVFLAIGGALWGGAGGLEGQFIGGVTGLVVGMGGAITVARIRPLETLGT